jgi:NitT/TauT family transport system ATP-binding protein
MDYLVQMKDVEVSYPTEEGGELRVLDNIDLRIRPREFVSLVGPTGCGKSTILRLLLGSQFPNRGSVLFEGKPIDAIDRHRGIVFQKYGLFPHRTVLDNIAFGPELELLNLWDRLFCFASPRYWRVTREQRGRARELVTRIGLRPGDCDKYPFELSGGMRQRVAIAQSLIMHPTLLMMDEAFGALDESTREEMQLLLLEEWEKNSMTVLFVTHNVAEALFLGTRVIGLSQHWVNDDGLPAQGARIIVDAESGGQHPKPTSYKYSTEFNSLLQKIREEVLDPDQRTRLCEFNLTHRDAFHD